MEFFRYTGRIQRDPKESYILKGNVELSEKSNGVHIRDSRHTWLNRILTGLEALSILMLFGLVLNGASVLKRLNQEVAASFQQPTFEPTPLISAIVLPEGHTPPNAPGGAQPNEAEIPEYLRPLAQSLANIPISTPGSQQAVRIQIPALDIDSPVVQGDGWEQLKLGVAQHAGTPNPGENGNIVLSGHNDVYGEVFRYLDRLMPGDIVILFTFQRQYTYVITGTQIVEPTQIEVMNPTPRPTLTLISCYPYLVDNRRIVVSAVLQTP
ncbi:MAG: hypothetical protein A2X25_11935 [Chloroflexi bacterium GWB2_49_20]|nr:MAG: hypothetical protein A2X25_11935 [Chloroflexi bacterium GWB2_49_20]OGN77713.1 MAG: hypothetical protein A2X26_10205 [Chloroflexi bacterium GWC2_49_37]OGN86488.1 MAG: hypothetical protein A2X27_06360 [Chloroflexi bacterium GWD2_49_16]